MEKRTFRLLSGTYTYFEDDEKITITKGQKVDSDEDLHLRYVNKFQLLDPNAVSITDDPDTINLEPMHKGHGKYVVINKVTGKEINEGGYLTKDQAYEWCGLEVPASKPKAPHTPKEPATLEIGNIVRHKCGQGIDDGFGIITEINDDILTLKNDSDDPEWTIDKTDVVGVVDELPNEPKIEEDELV